MHVHRMLMHIHAMMLTPANQYDYPMENKLYQLNFHYK